MPFTQQELEAAYKQMQDERKEEADLAALAAKKLSQALGQPISYRSTSESLWGRGYVAPSPHPSKHELFFELCQYDDWNGVLAALNNLGCNMKKSMIVGKGDIWNGEHDLSNDPDFATAHQKVYRVAIDTYDAHCTGY